MADGAVERPKYKWDWNEKLNTSPFRIEINRLREDSKKHPQQKRSNTEFKRILKQKEKDLLVEFQMKCDQAKLWINEANKDYGSENSDDPQILQRVQYQKQEEKIRTIDQFWDELLCQETIFLQDKKIKHQNQQMEELQQQLKETEQALNKLNELKKKKPTSNPTVLQQTAERTNVDDDHKTNEADTEKKQRKKKKGGEKEEYMGLVGYFNRPKKQNKNKKPNAKKKASKQSPAKAVDAVPASDAAPQGGGFFSVSYVPKDANDADGDGEAETVKENVSHDVEAKQETNELVEADSEQKTEMEPEQQQEAKKSSKKKGKKASRVIKGGFLNQGTKGLYDDKKLDSELTVDERNVKNKRQIDEMGFGEAVNNPLYTWERPKTADREKLPNAPKAEDPLTQFLNEQAQIADAENK